MIETVQASLMSFNEYHWLIKVLAVKWVLGILLIEWALKNYSPLLPKTDEGQPHVRALTQRRRGILG